MITSECHVPRVITAVVRNDLCIGCGFCVPACPTNAIQMQWATIGIYEPVANDKCAGCGDCLKVCPFSTDKKNLSYKTAETAIDELCVHPEHFHHDQHIGYYQQLLVGYSKNFRLFGSSGGLATWLLVHALSSKMIDAVFCVSENPFDSDSYFGYKICTSIEDVLKASKTRYYPAKSDEVVKFALETEGRYAFVGLPCAIKALRLTQSVHPELKQRIILTVGIFCGGMKTKYYLNYLASAAGCDVRNVSKPEFRKKNPASSADDYSFACTDDQSKSYEISMKSLGDMWGTGLFKPKACEFCEDISSEFSDISLGDAWIPPFKKDGAGTSLVVVRSEIARSMISHGIEQSELVLEKIDIEKINNSQRGNINHRIKGLGYRLLLANIFKQVVPVTKVRASLPKNPLFILIQHLRWSARAHSHVAWQAQVQSRKSGTLIYDSLMKTKLNRLKLFTNLSHRVSFLVDRFRQELGI